MTKMDLVCGHHIDTTSWPINQMIWSLHEHICVLWLPSHQCQCVDGIVFTSCVSSTQVVLSSFCHFVSVASVRGAERLIDIEEHQVLIISYIIRAILFLFYFGYPCVKKGSPISITKQWTSTLLRPRGPSLKKRHQSIVIWKGYIVVQLDICSDSQYQICICGCRWQLWCCCDFLLTRGICHPAH